MEEIEMKNYTITVNGNVYDVVVEEGASTGAAPVAAPKAPVAPKAAPKAAATRSCSRRRRKHQGRGRCSW